MARKTRTRTGAGRDAGDPTQAIRDSAQKIWLAGLGAFERAKTDGPRMFETLVEQGRNMGARAVGAADEALKTMRQADYSGTTQKLMESIQRQVETLNENLKRMAGTDQAGRSGARKARSTRRKASGAARPAAATARKGRKKASAGTAKRTTRKRAAGSRSRKAKA